MGSPGHTPDELIGPPFSFREESAKKTGTRSITFTELAFEERRERIVSTIRRTRVAKRYDEEIEVEPDPIDADAPVAFRWRGKKYEIDQRMSSWREAWTAGREGQRQREYFRVFARPSGASSDGNMDADGFLVQVGAVYDVYRDITRGGWRLARIWD